MAVFAYDPIRLKAWADKVVDYCDGEGNSMRAIAKRFKEQMAELVNPGVWTGTAAKQNYDDFVVTYESFQTFVNSFMNSFSSSMESLKKSVGELELANLGNLNNVGQFGVVQINELKEQFDANVTTDYVIYDYATITSIGTQLQTILSELDSVYEEMHQEISLIDDGSRMWDGNVASSAKGEMLSVLSTNYFKSKSNLQKCIKNIQTAAENATNADSTAN